MLGRGSTDTAKAFVGAALAAKLTAMNQSSCLPVGWLSGFAADAAPTKLLVRPQPSMARLYLHPAIHTGCALWCLQAVDKPRQALCRNAFDLVVIF